MIARDLLFQTPGTMPVRTAKNRATVGTVLFCDVRKFSRATSAMMMDVLIDEQELPEPVRLRAICVVPGEWEKLGRIRHERTTT